MVKALSSLFAVRKLLMKILIIDRDTMFSSLLATKIKAAGHDVFETAIKNDGIEQINTQKIDAVYFDPAPLSDPKSIILQVRRMVPNFVYLVLMGADVDRASVIKSSCHDGLSKPLDPQALAKTLDNAQRLGALVKKLADDKIDFPSAGGVISKSAFNQLFLSSMDRISRYGENSQAIFISIANYDDIKIDSGKYAADFAASKLAQTLSKVRRQSDILAQTGVNEYALLILSPQQPHEAVEAARRFASILQEDSGMADGGVANLQLKVSLVSLPSGSEDFQNISHLKGPLAQSAV